jgi:hypothetical protein
VNLRRCLSSSSENLLRIDLFARIDGAHKVFSKVLDVSGDDSVDAGLDGGLSVLPEAPVRVLQEEYNIAQRVVASTYIRSALQV